MMESTGSMMKTMNDGAVVVNDGDAMTRRTTASPVYPARSHLKSPNA